MSYIFVFLLKWIRGAKMPLGSHKGTEQRIKLRKNKITVNIKRHHTLSVCFPTLKVKFSLSKLSNICKSCQMLSNLHEILLYNYRAIISSLIIICVCFLSMMPKLFGFASIQFNHCYKKTNEKGCYFWKDLFKGITCFVLEFPLLKQN